MNRSLSDGGNAPGSLCVVCGVVPGDIVVRRALPDYEGGYEVTPGTEAIALATRDKSLREDLIVREIPYHTTTNLSGGYTAIIGG